MYAATWIKSRRGALVPLASAVFATCLVSFCRDRGAFPSLGAGAEGGRRPTELAQRGAGLQVRNAVAVRVAVNANRSELRPMLSKLRNPSGKALKSENLNDNFKSTSLNF
jgi:hypothetical protein